MADASAVVADVRRSRRGRTIVQHPQLFEE